MNSRLRTLIEIKFREVVQSGGNIAIVGWRDSNHSSVTRSLMDTGQVIFLHASRDPIPQNVELVLFTRFVDHETTKKAREGNFAFNHVLGTGEIKRLLKSIVVPNTARIISPIPGKLVDIKNNEMPESSATNPTSDFAAFVAEFKVLAKNHPSKWVGRRTLGSLRTQFGIIESAAKLESLQWIQSHIAKGKSEVGWYSAGEKMGPQISTEILPPSVITPISSNPRTAKVFQILSEEPALREEKVRLEGKLKVVNDRLGQIEFLKDAVDAIE